MAMFQRLLRNGAINRNVLAFWTFHEDRYSCEESDHYASRLEILNRCGQ
jgi:hypothetical protein